MWKGWSLGGRAPGQQQRRKPVTAAPCVRSAAKGRNHKTPFEFHCAARLV